jgi:precorrin-2/cobalt-factor-2 C20-methyltransferase
MAKLYGVGVGPGDRDLITIKAVKILEKADIVIAPASTGDDSIAYEIAAPYIMGKVMFMEFPMIHSKEQLEMRWDENVDIIKAYINSGNNVAFITIGDPMVYSTFIYILKRMAGFEVETIPGITSYNAAAAKVNIPIAEGKQSFVVVPSGDIQEIEKAFSLYDNIILMKVSQNYSEIIRIIKENKFKAVLIIRCGHDKEKIVYDLEGYNEKIDYLSIIIAKRV